MSAPPSRAAHGEHACILAGACSLQQVAAMPTQTLLPGRACQALTPLAELMKKQHSLGTSLLPARVLPSRCKVEHCKVLHPRSPILCCCPQASQPSPAGGAAVGSAHLQALSQSPADCHTNSC